MVLRTDWAWDWQEAFPWQVEPRTDWEMPEALQEQAVPFPFPEPGQALLLEELRSQQRDPLVWVQEERGHQNQRLVEQEQEVDHTCPWGSQAAVVAVPSFPLNPLAEADPSFPLVVVVAVAGTCS